MSIGARARRLTYLAHRWTGIFGCLLMLLWFVSGITMLFVGYPKLTLFERLAALPTLDTVQCCKTPTAGPAGDLPDTLVLTSVAGEPRFLTSDGGRPAAYSAEGIRRHGVSVQDALAAASAFKPGSRVQYGGAVQEDRWTHSTGLDAHRPLLRVDWRGADRGSVYVSSVTGQVVLDAPLAQQRWNYIGAWLHWLYFLRDTSVDPVWSWTVIVLSLVSTVTALTGACVGIWRWRFRHRYKSGSRSPYREKWMRWHHVTGLLFGALVCTWIFSGVMSMNPLGVFTSSASRPNLNAYHGQHAAPAQPVFNEPATLIQALKQSGFQPVELHWRTLNAERYVLAYDAEARTRVLRWQAQELNVFPHFSADDVRPAVRHLYPAPVSSMSYLTHYDAYYYQRHPEAMNGGRQFGLPALRVVFDHDTQTVVYVDLATGNVARVLPRPERLGRWLFYFLHSWDVPTFLVLGWLRDLVLILLSLGGIVVSASGVVIGLRRLFPRLSRQRDHQ